MLRGVFITAGLLAGVVGGDARAATEAAVLAARIATVAPITSEVRPFGREDAAAQRQAARLTALQSVRPLARPVHMIRYPVNVIAGAPPLRPAIRPNFIPDTRWGSTNTARMWTRATMAAVATHGLDTQVPRDIAAWCPAYAQNSPTLRRAFWVGMMSALTKYESTHNPNAVGGGGLWYGLLQILPATARGYGCRATTGAALKDPIANLACAARIMGHTVARDRAVAVQDGRWRGVAADWGPMSNRAKIAEMSAWTRKQDYCVVQTRPRPMLRPESRVVENAGAPRPVLRDLSPTISTMDTVTSAPD
ncbi:Transglycosylase SLT domain-containing protein [Loktanella sp. DSM 29012]|uniref:transglycosylase SLT domain-containing protein n=1 Tax=Loktanella sp. DSM 29012 TaxID=1881056 RepID=UPI0008BC08DA|nr:Transglycosylase SLT domain-containing protein [Loktanella sp. DSM 29012]